MKIKNWGLLWKLSAQLRSVFFLWFCLFDYRHFTVLLGNLFLDFKQAKLAQPPWDSFCYSLGYQHSDAQWVCQVILPILGHVALSLKLHVVYLILKLQSYAFGQELTRLNFLMDALLEQRGGGDSLSVIL